MATVYGITPTGFVLKRLADIRQDMVDALATVQDPLTGEKLIVDLADENDPLVQLVDALSDSLAVNWEQLQDAYNQFDPLKAVDAGLSGLVQLNGILRKAGSFSTAVVTLTGSAGQVISEGGQISDINDTNTWTLPAFTFDGVGSASVIATCTIRGPVVALAGSLVKINTPVSGWDAVTNPADATIGVAQETDTQLRSRQQFSTSTAGFRQIDSIVSGLLNLPDVTFVSVLENNGLLVDANGIPGKTIAPVIVGGDDTAVASELFDKVPIGIQYVGNTNVIIQDAQNNDYTITYTRPTGVPITVVINVTVIDTALWPVDGPDLITAAILAYASDTNTGFAPGADVVRTRLYTPVNEIQGMQINSLQISKEAAPVSDNNVVIAWNEVATFDSAIITINVV